MIGEQSQRVGTMPEGRLRLPDRDGIRRILIMKWSAMGDIVLASALFEDIRRAFPAAEIDLNILPPWDRLFRDDPRFRRLLVTDLRGSERGLPGMRRWLREVRAARYDLLIDLQSNDRSRLLLTLLWATGGAPAWRVGNHRRLPYNIAPERQPTAVHAFEHQRATLRAAGIVPRTERPALYVSPASRERARELARSHGLRDGHYAVFMPGCQAAGHLKRWGAHRYAELARRLRQRGVAHIALIGGPDELDECARIEASCGGCVVNLCGKTEIPEIVPLVEGACFVVANDTGTAHVASAVDHPLVVICGPTDPRRVRPAGGNVVTLQAELPCINCYRKECSHHSCMAAIEPEQVMDAVGRGVISACSGA